MSDGERMVLARTERYGGAATVIIWDVLGNEPVRRLVYESPVGFVDQISYVGVSRDNRYIVAGYQVRCQFLSSAVRYNCRMHPSQICAQPGKFCHCWPDGLELITR